MPSINQRKKLEEKLRLYNQPFIEASLVKEIIAKFAPNYEIKSLCSRGLLSMIKKWDLYLNLLSSKLSWLIGTTILAQYGQWKIYTVGWLHLYNQYHYSEQLADRVTVYNTSIRGKRIIANYKFIFRKVSPSFFRGIEKVDAQWYGKYNRMTRERALIQLLIDDNGKLEYPEDVYNEFRKWAISKQKLIQLSQKHASKRVQSLISDFLKEWQI